MLYFVICNKAVAEMQGGEEVDWPMTNGAEAE